MSNELAKVEGSITKLEGQVQQLQDKQDEHSRQQLTALQQQLAALRQKEVLLRQSQGVKQHGLVCGDLWLLATNCLFKITRLMQLQCLLASCCVLTICHTNKPMLCLPFVKVVSGRRQQAACGL